MTSLSPSTVHYRRTTPHSEFVLAPSSPISEAEEDFAFGTSRHRQTKLHEHLKTVKPISPSIMLANAPKGSVDRRPSAPGPQPPRSVPIISRSDKASLMSKVFERGYHHLTDEMVDAILKQFITVAPDGAVRVVPGGLTLDSFISTMLRMFPDASRSPQSKPQTADPFLDTFEKSASRTIYASARTSARSAPDLAAVAATQTPVSRAVPATVRGMGRVAVSRHTLRARFGTDEAAEYAAFDPFGPAPGAPRSTSPPTSKAAHVSQSSQGSVASASSGAPASALHAWLASGSDSDSEADSDRDAWSTLPPEGPESDDDEPPRVSVGGKSVRALADTQPAGLGIARVAYATPAVVDAPLPYSGKKRGRKPKARASDAPQVTCVCNSEGAPGVPLLQCTSCHSWSHVACVLMDPSRVPAQWLCHSCSAPAVSRLKRSPLLVANVISPRPSGSYRRPAQDQLLSAAFHAGAPAPPPPRPVQSPVPARPVVHPTTPRMGAGAGTIPPRPQTNQYSSVTLLMDYSPRSPLTYRSASRTRAHTRTASDQLPDVAEFYDPYGTYSHRSPLRSVSKHRHTPSNGSSDERSWDDLTMTPSRALYSSHWHSDVNSTPLTSFAMTPGYTPGSPLKRNPPLTAVSSSQAFFLAHSMGDSRAGPEKLKRVEDGAFARGGDSDVCNGDDNAHVELQTLDGGADARDATPRTPPSRF